MNVERLSGLVALGSGAVLVAGLLVVGLSDAGPGVAGTGTTVMPAVPFAMPMMGPAAMPMMGRPGAMAGMHAGAMHGWGRGAATRGPIAGATEVRVQMLSFRFEPSEIHLPAGRDVNVTLANTTGVVHDLTVPVLGIQVVAAPGTTRTIGLSSLPAGRYVAYCGVPGHAEAGMRATLVVE